MKKHLLPLVSVAALLLSSAAHADVATLVSPANGEAMTEEGGIRLELAADLPQEILNRLFLELDGVDVTSFVTLNGGVVGYDPPQKLAPGDHLLRLYEQTSPGKFTPVQHWTVRVSGGGFASPDVNGNLDANYRYLAADNLDEGVIEDHSGDANLNLTAAAGGERWDTSAALNTFYDSKQSNNQDEEHAQLGEYLLTGRGFSENTTTTLKLGNHDAGLSNLLVNGFNRRGLSAEAEFFDRFALIGFAQDPARAIGDSNVFGFNRKDQRADGLFIKAYPLADDGERLLAEAGYYFGRGTIAGDGVSKAADLENKGDGYVLALEGQTPDDKINLRGEVAGTKFDEDSTALTTYRADMAYSGRLQYAPIGSLNGAGVDNRAWRLYALYNRIGTYFKTLANLGATPDDHRLTLTSDYTHNTLGFVSEAFVVENNVEGDPALPTDRGYGFSGQLSFMPADIKSDIDTTGLWGVSTFTFGGSHINQRRDETPAGFLGGSLDHITYTVNGGWTLGFETASLSLNHTYSDIDDQADTTNSTRTHFSELSASWTPNQIFTVSPALQLEVNKTRPDDVTRRVFAGIDTSLVLIPDKLTNSFHYSALMGWGGPDTDENRLSTEFTYLLKQAERNSPGYALALSGDYEDGNDNGATAKNENYRVFLALRFSAPFGF